MAGDRTKVPAMAPRTRPIYDNCRVLDISGELLFRAGQRRVDWYLARGLARRVDPQTIQLAFANRGSGRRDEPFYPQDMRNECVVCGSAERLTMHHVVPHQYRHHMEEAVKSRSSHDLLPLCTACHDAYEAHAVRFKQHLAVCFAAPLQGTGWTARRDIGRAQRAAAALASPAVAKIPAPRVAELQAAVDEAVRANAALLGADARSCIDECRARGAGVWTSAAVLDGLLALETQVRGPDYRSHGEIVVAAAPRPETCGACRALAAGGPAALVAAWRRHFVECARPAHLPDHWSVDHPLCDAGAALGA
ncbi:hypothetical protein H4R21_000413 [Coemansia helicoidea]|uniref:Uncharacterized protein n=1 Tax=Coemansia helicoidea TaxID=1286919 RepID=A0ACC1LGN8_9FUNG|nr:hypothetical protein H4R21_000413 [Coemansia helicoidea]